MFCTHCGKELPDDARFCTGCGNAVTPANTPQQSSAPAEAKTPAPCKKVYEEQQETGGTAAERPCAAGNAEADVSGGRPADAGCRHTV